MRQAAGSDPSLGGGASLAARAARFRGGAPFLVERATLFDPDPLDALAVPADRRRPRSPHAMLPAALTLLGVVVVVGLAAGVLFVRNADGPRKHQGTGRLEQFSERVVPHPAAKVPSPDAPIPRDRVSYDLTRRTNDRIVGAWRLPKDATRQPAVEVKHPDKPQPVKKVQPIEIVRPVDEAKPSEEASPTPLEAAPAPSPQVVSAPTEAPTDGLRRLMPRRLNGWLSKRRAEQVAERAEPAVTPRAPLDEPHVPKVSTEIRPTPPPRAPLDEPHVPKSTAEAERGRQHPDSGGAEHPGANVVARVGRETEPNGPAKEKRDLGEPPAVELPEAEQRQAARERRAAQRAQRAELRRRREARLFAKDVDRFHMRDKGEVPYGFVFSGPQAQRP